MMGITSMGEFLTCQTRSVDSRVMWTRVAGIVGVAVACVGIVGCSSESDASSTEPTEQSLRSAAESLDKLAAEGDAKTAWGMYSQRCQKIIGDVDTYETIVSGLFKDRTPDYTDWKVTVNGSSGSVVTIDSDPSAPVSSLQPRTWTFIDGRWQFDNC